MFQAYGEKTNVGLKHLQYAWQLKIYLSLLKDKKQSDLYNFCQYLTASASLKSIIKNASEKARWEYETSCISYHLNLYAI
ncbi:hypothetical protein FKM82_009841 [Ascaphus truei]